MVAAREHLRKTTTHSDYPIGGGAAFVGELAAEFESEGIRNPFGHEANLDSAGDDDFSHSTSNTRPLRCSP